MIGGLSHPSSSTPPATATTASALIHNDAAVDTRTTATSRRRNSNNQHYRHSIAVVDHAFYDAHTHNHPSELHAPSTTTTTATTPFAHKSHRSGCVACRLRAERIDEAKKRVEIVKAIRRVEANEAADRWARVSHSRNEAREISMNINSSPNEQRGRRDSLIAGQGRRDSMLARQGRPTPPVPTSMPMSNRHARSSSISSTASAPVFSSSSPRPDFSHITAKVNSNLSAARRSSILSPTTPTPRRIETTSTATNTRRPRPMSMMSPPVSLARPSRTSVISTAPTVTRTTTTTTATRRPRPMSMIAATTTTTTMSLLTHFPPVHSPRSEESPHSSQHEEDEVHEVRLASPGMFQVHVIVKTGGVVEEDAPQGEHRAAMEDGEKERGQLHDKGDCDQKEKDLVDLNDESHCIAPPLPSPPTDPSLEEVTSSDIACSRTDTEPSQAEPTIIEPSPVPSLPPVLTTHLIASAAEPPVSPTSPNGMLHTPPTPSPSPPPREPSSPPPSIASPTEKPLLSPTNPPSSERPLSFKSIPRPKPNLHTLHDLHTTLVSSFSSLQAHHTQRPSSSPAPNSSNTYFSTAETILMTSTTFLTTFAPVVRQSSDTVLVARWDGIERKAMALLGQVGSVWRRKKGMGGDVDGAVVSGCRNLVECLEEGVGVVRGVGVGVASFEGDDLGV
ncbi:hypothetical protein BC832DRAFT_622777 [Gaertneriomyces semiglobifer]|nr:hypothetical protein BC832DRAFT_622777 [Gaertneriomyces semiglobifer]